MKKLITFLTASLMAISLMACSSTKSNSDNKSEDTKATTEKKEEIKSYSPKEIEEVIAKALGDGYPATVDVSEDELLLSALGYLDMTKVKSYVAKQAAIPSVDLDTVVIVDCEDGYADEAVKGFQKYFENQISYVRQYPFNVAKVEGTKIIKQGNCVMLIVAGASASDEATEEEAAKLASSEYEKIENTLKEFFGADVNNLAKIVEPEVNTNNSEDVFDGGFDGGIIIGD